MVTSAEYHLYNKQQSRWLLLAMIIYVTGHHES